MRVHFCERFNRDQKDVRNGFPQLDKIVSLGNDFA